MCGIVFVVLWYVHVCMWCDSVCVCVQCGVCMCVCSMQCVCDVVCVYCAEGMYMCVVCACMVCAYGI